MLQVGPPEITLGVMNAQKQSFDALDQNGDGVIDRAEFQRMAAEAAGADGELITVVAQRMGTFEASLVR